MMHILGAHLLSVCVVPLDACAGGKVCFRVIFRRFRHENSVEANRENIYFPKRHPICWCDGNRREISIRGLGREKFIRQVRFHEVHKSVFLLQTRLVIRVHGLRRGCCSDRRCGWCKRCTRFGSVASMNATRWVEKCGCRFSQKMVTVKA